MVDVVPMMDGGGGGNGENGGEGGAETFVPHGAMKDMSNALPVHHVPVAEKRGGVYP
jgi:hypothetical protein